MLKVVLLVVVVAVVIYLVLRLIERGGAARGGAGRTVAPDDDVDFLRDIDRRRPHNGSTDPGEDGNEG